MISAALDYGKRIYFARYFWSHLALADLRAKYRRSTMGILWAMLQPLAFTLLLSFVMGNLFKTSLTDYIPFVFSGLLVWEFITSSMIAGTNALINGEMYIKQFNHPMMIYPLRHVLASAITFVIASLGLLIWVAFWQPSHFLVIPFMYIISLPLLFITLWPLSILVAFLGAAFRDFQQLIVIVMQALWYISPVFFQPQMFYAANLNFLVDYNPIYHVLNLFRQPLLHGDMPPLESIIFVTMTALLCWILTMFIVSKKESKIIFYL